MHNTGNYPLTYRKWWKVSTHVSLHRLSRPTWIEIFHKCCKSNDHRELKCSLLWSVYIKTILTLSSHLLNSQPVLNTAVHLKKSRFSKVLLSGFYYPDNEEIDESELCCLCIKMSPPYQNDYSALKIVNWAQFNQCKHWVHLAICTAQKLNNAKAHSDVHIACSLKITHEALSLDC